MTKQKQNLGTTLIIKRRFDAILPACRKDLKRDVRAIGDNLKEMGYEDVSYNIIEKDKIGSAIKNVEIQVWINNSTQMDEIKMEVEEYFPEFKILLEVL